jgi:chloride channel 7
MNRYALLGVASFLRGSMRMTVSLCVIMVEITNNLQLLPLIMLVLLISKVTNLYFTLFGVFPQKLELIVVLPLESTLSYIYLLL